MAEILKGATLVEFSPPRAEKADLRVDGGTIVERGKDLAAKPGDLVTDLSGRIVTGGFVISHTHLYNTLTRGAPPPADPPRSFREMLEKIWWKLDRALDERTIELSAKVGAAEALQCGVTTLVDLHSSPAFVEGSLSAVRRGIDSIGLRSVLAYETSDRNGKPVRDAALRETEAFLKAGQTSRCRAMVGGHASFTLDQDSLAAMVELSRRYNVGVHLHVAETPEDELDCRKRFDKGVMERLLEAGVIGPRSLLVNGTHFAWEDLSLAQQNGVWLIHNPRSNMHHAVGYAPAGKFGARKALGTDGLSYDLLGEVQFAYFKANEAGAPINPLLWMIGGQRLATETFGLPMGPLEHGAAADLVVLDYPFPTFLNDQTLPDHLAFGLRSAHVDSVMVDGAWRLWARQILSLDYDALRAKSAETAGYLWTRMREV